MSDIITITIDGEAREVDRTWTILEAARHHGIDIPTLCHDPRLPPTGSCLMCVVEVEGRHQLMLSCTSQVMEGMVITTRNERIDKARKNALDLLLSNHFADCRGPCYDACPAGVDVQGYLALTNAGKHQEALELILETNPLPSVCGRVCVRKCEVVCRRQEVDEAVGINFVKRFVADGTFADLATPLKAKGGKKVAIVGGGPAGLTAGYYLARAGYAPTIFEAEPKLGGMLRYGIPDYRLPQDILDRDIDYILAHGVEVKTDTRLGSDVTIDGLKSDGYEAILLTLGAQLPKPMRVENEDTEGVLGGVDFLRDSVKEGAAELKGHVIVVGGGNTAIDAARTALRCNAAKVTILYRRTKAEMPAHHEEIEDAIDEGVEIRFLEAPLEVIADEHGRVKKLRVQKMRLGEPDASGRRRPVPIEGDVEDIVCNTIIAAIGQDVDVGGLAGGKDGDVETTRWRTIVTTDGTYATNIDGVFSAGDVMTGPAVAIDAIAQGHESAVVIDGYLGMGTIEPIHQEFLSKKTALGEIPRADLEAFPPMERVSTTKDDAVARVLTFDEVDHGITADEALHESLRCLSCGCSDVFSCDLKQYADQYGAEQGRYQGAVKKYLPDLRHPYIKLDPSKCVLCGKCVRLCEDILEVGALGFINRGFDMVVRPSMNRALHETTCISCGNCIEICPTGAIDYHLPFGKPGPWTTHEESSVCSYCGVGCDLVYHKRDDDLWWIGAEPVSPHQPGELCARGRFGHRFVATTPRVDEPRITGDDGTQHPTTVTTALDKVLEGLHGVAKEHGPESLAFFVSPHATNEEISLVTSLARDVFGTNQVASIYDVAGPAGGRELREVFGMTASTVSREDLDKADLIVTCNTDVIEENPVLGFALKRAVRKGATMVSLSATENETTELASMVLDTRRGTTTTLFEAVAKAIVTRGAVDEAFVKSRTTGYDELVEALGTSIEEAADTTGVDAKRIETLVDLLADPANDVVFIYNPESPLEKAQGDLTMIANLLMLLGKVGRPGNGLLLAHKYSNHQGLTSLGAYPEAGAGKGLAGATTVHELRARLFDGSIRGLFIFGEDLSLNAEYDALLTGAQFVAACDMFETETTRSAHVVLPGTGYAESAGSVTTLDRRVKAFGPVLPAPAGQTGLDLLAALLGRATKAEAPSLTAIRARIAAATPTYASLETLVNGQSFQWSDDGSEELLFEETFATHDGKGHFVAPEASPEVIAAKGMRFSTIDSYYVDPARSFLASRGGGV